MSFSIVLTVALVAGMMGPIENLSISQVGLAGDRCPKDQMLLNSECVNLPKLLKKPTPRYPDLARRALVEATVGLSATLQPDGTIADIRVTSPAEVPKLGFEDSVSKALEKWRFQPVLLDGKPVAVPFEVKVEFKLSSR